jgi:hypothetical protein
VTRMRLHLDSEKHETQMCLALVIAIMILTGSAILYLGTHYQVTAQTVKRTRSPRRSDPSRPAHHAAQGCGGVHLSILFPTVVSSRITKAAAGRRLETAHRDKEYAENEVSSARWVRLPSLLPRPAAHRPRIGRPGRSAWSCPTPPAATPT